MTDYCKTPGCEDEVKYPTYGLCAACYSYIRKWHKRSAQAQIERVNQITRYQTRFEMIGAPISFKRVKLSNSQRIKIFPGEAKVKVKQHKVG